MPNCQGNNTLGKTCGVSTKKAYNVNGIHQFRCGWHNSVKISKNGVKRNYEQVKWFKQGKSVVFPDLLDDEGFGDPQH